MPSDREQPSILVAKLSDLRQVFGHHFVDALQDLKLLGASHDMSTDQNVLAEELMQWADAHAAVAPTNAELDRRALLLGDFPGPLGEPTRAASGPLERELCALAERAHPAFIINADPRRFDSMAPLRLRSLLEHQRVEASIRDIPSMAPLFTEIAAENVRTRWSGRHPFAKMFDPIELITANAWELCLLRGTWALSDFQDTVLEHFDRVVRTSRGEVVDFPVFFGFGHVTHDADLHIPAAVRGYRGGLQSCLLDPADRLSREGGGIVVERRLPWTWRVGASTDEAGESECRGELEASEWRDLAHWAASFSIAVALARVPQRIGPEDLRAPADLGRMPALRWVFGADPVMPLVRMHVTRGWEGLTTTSVSVTEETLSKATTLAAYSDPRLRLAIGRLYGALDSTQPWQDRLIDAVIAWETLSGDCQDAVTVKVSAVVAHLVAEPKHRSQVRATLRKLYSTRCHVVHGSPSKTATQRDANAALLCGLAALDALTVRFPAVMEKTKRFEYLCLDDQA